MRNQIEVILTTIMLLMAVVSSNQAIASSAIDSCIKFAEIEPRTNKSYHLSQDIDCSGYTLTNPVDFNGQLDGKGYTIRNLTIDTNSRYAGFFAEIDGASINDISFENITLNVGSSVNAAGILAGDIQNSKLENITITHSKIQATGEAVAQGVGMAAGRFSSQSEASGINVLHSKLWVEKSSHVGSLFGYMADSYMSFLSARNNQLIVEGNYRVNFGGIVGYLSDASLLESESTDNLLSAPIIDKGNIGMLSGYIVTGRVVGVTLARNVFDTQIQTNHLRLAILSGYIDNPKDSAESPSLKDVTYYGSSSLEWFNNKDAVHTDNFIRVE